MNLFHIKSCN